jgi:hypothetical protein
MSGSEDDKSLPAENNQEHDNISEISMSSLGTVDDYSDLDLTDEETAAKQPIKVGDLVHRHAPRRMRRKNIGIITSIKENNAIIKIRLTNKIRKVPLTDIWLSVSEENIADFFFNSEYRQLQNFNRIHTRMNALQREIRIRDDRNNNILREIEHLRDTNSELTRELYVKQDNMTVEELMKKTIHTIRQEPEYINCRCQINAYREHNHGIKKDMKERLIVLDERYIHLSRIINGIQISIIFGSTLSAFFQASAPHTHLDERIISLISLCIATYTSLLLAITKYMKYDESKEGIHSLQQQFAEFLIQLETRDDQLNTWCSDSFWAGHDVNKKRNQWLKLEEQLQGGFQSLIDRKANLCCEYEKEMDTGSQKKTALYARRQALDIKLQKNNLLKFEIKAAQKSEKLKRSLQDVEQGTSGDSSEETKKPGPSSPSPSGEGYRGHSLLRSTPVIGNATEPPVRN